MSDKSFKSKWNSKDEVCPNCGQITKVNRGLTKQNLGKLFKKPSSQDLIMLIMILLILFGAWAYKSDVERYQETIKHPGELCSVYLQAINKGNFGDNTYIDIDEFGNFTIKSTNNFNND